MTVRIASFRVESLSLGDVPLDSSTIGSAFNGGTISNPLFVSNTTQTTSTNTGALRVAGGVGINRNLFVGGIITVDRERLDLRTSGDLRFYNTNNTRFVGFSAPDAISADRTYILPPADGTSGQFLRTNGAGVLTWASAGSAAGIAAAGADKQIQFNDNETFGANAGLTFDSNLQILSTPIINASGKISTEDTTVSTSTTTGALTVAGGVGVQHQLNVGGPVNTFSGNTASTSTTTGTIVVTGGVGVSGSINAGSTVTSPPAPTSENHLTNKRYVDANILAFSVAFGA
jgi:hypothetical protein